jgi:repressor LexA
MTPQQTKIIFFIREFIQQHGYSPSLTEIAQGIGISPKSISLISRHIHALAAAGKLNFHKEGYRNLSLPTPENFSLPVIGKIAAGSPIEAIENSQQLDLQALFHQDQHYVLEVKGNSMIEEGILDGDFVICKRTKHANEGDIVVALIDNQVATLKRISYKLKDKITLLPANAALKPSLYAPEQVQVQGIFTGLLRLKGKQKA